MFSDSNAWHYSLLKIKYQIFSGRLMLLYKESIPHRLRLPVLKADKDGNYRFSLISAVGIDFGMGTND
jgi:hypothetical protein